MDDVNINLFGWRSLFWYVTRWLINNKHIFTDQIDGVIMHPKNSSFFWRTRKNKSFDFKLLMFDHLSHSELLYRGFYSPLVSSVWKLSFYYCWDVPQVPNCLMRIFFTEFPSEVHHHLMLMVILGVGFQRSYIL